MNHVLVGELDQAMSEAEEDDSIAAIILTGAGDRAFSAGADIHEQREDATKRESGELTEDEDRHHRATRSQASWHVGSASKPTIGALNGLSYGGGSVLASSLDIRIGCERSRFRFLAAAYGRLNCTWTLPQQVGWPIAKELLFTGRVVEPDEAHRIGLLNHLVSHDRVMEKAREIAVTIAGNNQNSVRGLKKLLMEDVGSRVPGYVGTGAKLPEGRLCGSPRRGLLQGVHRAQGAGLRNHGAPASQALRPRSRRQPYVPSKGPGNGEKPASGISQPRQKAAAFSSLRRRPESSEPRRKEWRPWIPASAGMTDPIGLEPVVA